MRSRVLNPDWLESMEEHGYKGAGDLSTTVDVTLGWDATTGVVSGHAVGGGRREVRLRRGSPGLDA